MKVRFEIICLFLFLLQTAFGRINCLASRAHDYQDSLLAEVKKENSPQKKIELLCRLSEAAQGIDTRDAIEYAAEAAQIADSVNLKKENAKALNLWGIAWKNRGDNLKSAELLTRALDIYEKEGSENERAEVLKNIGETYRASGDLKKSITYLNQAFQIFQACKDSAGLAKTYNRLAATSLELYYWDEQYRDIDKASINARDFISAVAAKPALQAKLDSLNTLIDLSIGYAQKLKLSNILISSQIIKAALCSSNHDFGQSLSIYQEVLKTIEENNDPVDMPLALYNMGVLYSRSGHIEQAIEYGEKSFQMAVEQDIKTYVILSSGLLSELYQGKKDFQKAYRYQKINADAWKENFKTDIDLRIKSVQADHEIAEKELQIQSKKKLNLIMVVSFSSVIGLIFIFAMVLLRKNKRQKLLNDDLQQKNRIISEKNDALAMTNSEKDKFFSILAHDVRGPLSSFLSLTEFVNENLDEMSSEELQNIAVSMNVSARNLYEMLSNLLDWSRMQRGIIVYQPRLVNLKKLALNTLDLVVDAARNKSVELTTDISEDIAVFADANMLSSVLRNLLSNAIKFTTSGGNVQLTARRSGTDKIEISVEDNGIGIPENLIKNLFLLNGGTSRTGTDGEPSSGLGLLICCDFIERHGSHINVESKVGKGTCFRFILDSTDKDSAISKSK